jgi:hypothetical protein
MHSVPRVALRRSAFALATLLATAAACSSSKDEAGTSADVVLKPNARILDAASLARITAISPAGAIAFDGHDGTIDALAAGDVIAGGEMEVQSRSRAEEAAGSLDLAPFMRDCARTGAADLRGRGGAPLESRFPFRGAATLARIRGQGRRGDQCGWLIPQRPRAAVDKVDDLQNSPRRVHGSESCARRNVAHFVVKIGECNIPLRDMAFPHGEDGLLSLRGALLRRARIRSFAPLRVRQARGRSVRPSHRG